MFEASISINYSFLVRLGVKVLPMLPVTVCSLKKNLCHWKFCKTCEKYWCSFCLLSKFYWNKTVWV